VRFVETGSVIISVTKAIVYSSVNARMPRTKPDAPRPDSMWFSGTACEEQHRLWSVPNFTYEMPLAKVPEIIFVSGMSLIRSCSRSCGSG
jgi:hypothetical protein